VARTKATATRDDEGTTTDPATVPVATDDPGSYTVVARRYRPQRFEDVVGQDHVVQALRNAIAMNRVTHAYLFSGTRGVGKTSIARIFAKCLNCQQGPTATPCNQCDICRAIAAGQDVDVIEIDGASNNGVEAVRELRQNAGLRPSRSRFKIYYIDEVHMLSTGAFNALLKTLEEPPEHVKFLFATTEPNKIPITVLSRCQRYDFAGISPEQIIESLGTICAREGIQADREALQAVARRAGGSMRDAQSLLEQLLSFGGDRLTADLVHQALGLAPDDRVLDLIDALADRDAARALALLDEAAGTGVQPVELLNGLLDFLRDLMVVAVGAEVDTLAAVPGQRVRLRAVAERWGLDTILAALQILAETRGRLRGSPHGRLLVELALCRVARLEDLVEIGELIRRLGGEGGGPDPKKKVAVADRPPAPAATPASAPVPSRPSAPPPAPVPRPDPPPVSVSAPTPPPAPAPAVAVDAGPLPRLEDAARAWGQLPERVGPRLGIHIPHLKPLRVEAPGVLVVGVPGRYNWAAEQCQSADALGRIGPELARLVGRSLALRFTPMADEPDAADAAPANSAQRADEITADPLVRQAIDLFDARRVKVELEEDGPS
jgi:DNA polymerase-3 subunit gamma/tau